MVIIICDMIIYSWLHSFCFSSYIILICFNTNIISEIVWNQVCVNISWSHFGWLISSMGYELFDSSIYYVNFFREVWVAFVQLIANIKSCKKISHQTMGILKYPKKHFFSSLSISWVDDTINYVHSRQRCVLSPFFFQFICRKNVRGTVEERIEGITANGLLVNNIRYADDTVLLVREGWFTTLS